jgi:hypothetical protein
MKYNVRWAGVPASRNAYMQFAMRRLVRWNFVL